MLTCSALAKAGANVIVRRAPFTTTCRPSRSSVLSSSACPASRTVSVAAQARRPERASAGARVKLRHKSSEICTQAQRYDMSARCASRVKSAFADGCVQGRCGDRNRATAS
jgi:hypothetical protein